MAECTLTDLLTDLGKQAALELKIGCCGWHASLVVVHFLQVLQHATAWSEQLLKASDLRCLDCCLHDVWGGVAKGQLPATSLWVGICKVA
jgi:hypothetical protein